MLSDALMCSDLIPGGKAAVYPFQTAAYLTATEKEGLLTRSLQPSCAMTGIPGGKAAAACSACHCCCGSKAVIIIVPGS